MAQTGGCGFLVHSLWFCFISGSCAWAEESKVPPVSVHAWNDLCHGADSCLERGLSWERLRYRAAPLSSSAEGNGEHPTAQPQSGEH